MFDTIDNEIFGVTMLLRQNGERVSVWKTRANIESTGSSGTLRINPVEQ